MTVSQTRFSSKPIGKLVTKRAAKRGLTLIEIMIALTMTLIVLGAMMSAFRYASEKMQMGRGVMEMANRLRSAEELLRNDLANLTLDPRPYTESMSPSGFLEIVEGAGNDAANANTLAANYLGDIDDSIGMTVRSADGRKFRGTLNGDVIESTIAEVWYFTTINDLDSSGTVEIEDSVRLHRRALLIRPDLGVLETGQNVGDVAAFVRNNDVSVRVVQTSPGSFNIVANTLADLAVRRNRFAHTNVFPSQFQKATIVDPADPLLKDNGEDILLTDVAGFDVRVYSPNATVHYSGASTDTILVEPGDPGYSPSATTLNTSAGAFVDLGYTGLNASEWFSGAAAPKSQLALTYDTWSPSYEHDGIDQDGVDGIDQGTNGINNGGTAAPDDDGERETRPPYPYPVRGIQISTRLIEKTTRQVHQSSVIQSYVPE